MALLASRTLCGGFQPSRNNATCLRHAPADARRLMKEQRKSVVANMIGFNFGDDEDSYDSKGSSIKTDKPSVKITSFSTLASSLLLYQHVFKGSVGEAFLGAMTAAVKPNASNKDVLGAYARFYNILVTAGFETWEDYVLDQILLGRDNAFARAVAQGNADKNAPLLAAVAYDLDALQKMAQPLDKLAKFIGDSAPVAGSYWVDAGSSATLKAPQKQLPGDSSPTTGIQLYRTEKFIQLPPTAEELTQWKLLISNKELWSEAVQLVQQYYHLHGFGITSRNTVLRWNKGAFEEGNEGTLLKPLNVLETQRARLAANTQRHMDGLPADHVLVAGPSGSGKSYLLWDSTLAAARNTGVRIVEVTPSEFPNILDIARGCSRYPRVRFILVADHLDFPIRGSLAADLMSGLSGSGPSGWPSNTILYIGATPTSAISIDALVSRFGTVLTTPESLSEDDFGGVVREMVGEEVEVPDDEIAAAVIWAKSRGGLNIRNANLYVRQGSTQS